MIRELWAMLTRYIHDQARARVLGTPAEQDREQIASAVAAAQTAADLASRSKLWAIHDQVVTGRAPDRIPLELPKVPDLRVVEAFVLREPRLAHSAEAIAGIYRLGGMSAIRAVDTVTLRHVRDRLATAARDGIPTERIAQEIARDQDWPKAYARTVVRTNLATAASDGVQSLMRDPMMREALPALEYVTAGDSRVRPARGSHSEENHRALDGLVAPVDWPGWDQWTPPLGFS